MLEYKLSNYLFDNTSLQTFSCTKKENILIEKFPDAIGLDRFIGIRDFVLGCPENSGSAPFRYYLLKNLTEDTRVLLALYGIQLIKLSDDASEYICVNRYDQIYHAYTKIWKKI